MQRYSNRFFYVLLAVICSGCAINPPPRVDVERNAENFYTGRYVGNQRNCFPPIGNKICFPTRPDEVQFETDKNLDIESFWIYFKSFDFVASDAIRERLFLTASDLTLQRGFEMFTVISERQYSRCSSSPTATTSGTVSGGVYTGTTTVRQNTLCSYTSGMKVLIFRDKDDLQKGVLLRNFAFSNQLRVEQSLYFGTTPGIEDHHVNGPYVSGLNLVTSTPQSAWKTHYDAKGLSADLRRKLGFTATTPIAFKDPFASTAEKKSEDFIQKNRVSAP